MKVQFEYIKYRWNTMRQGSTDSTFINDFNKNCLSIQLDNSSQSILKQLVSRLSGDLRVLAIEDHGVGSKRMGNQRSVRQLARTSASRGKYGELLYRIAKHYSPNRSLELGTSIGIGSTYIYHGYPAGEITTIEGCPATRLVALEHLPNTINSLEGRFSEVIPTLRKEPYDFIFIDGHHDGQATLDYLEQLLVHAHDQTIFLFDDIRWSASMFSAWNTICNDRRFNVTIDLFRMGIAVRNASEKKAHAYLTP